MRRSAKAWFLALLVAAALAVVPSAVSGQEKAVPEAWKSLDAQGLVDLAKQLATQGEAGMTERARLVDFVADRYLAAADETRRLTCPQWRTLAEALGKAVAEPVRRGWRETLRGAFSEPKVLAAMTSADMQDLKAAIESLGDPQSHTVLVDWMATGTTAWTSMTTEELVWLVQRLSDCGDGAKPHKARVAEYVVKERLATPELMRKAGCWAVFELAWHLNQVADEALRRAWVDTLGVAYADPGTVVSLTAERVLQLHGALRMLGDKQAYRVLVTWMSGSPAWRSLKNPDELTRLAQGIEEGGDATRPLRASLLEHILKDRLATPEAARAVTGEGWRSLVSSLGSVADDAARRTWADTMRGAFSGPKVLTTMKPEDVVDLAEALDVLGDKDSSVPLVAFMAANPSWQSMDPWHLARAAQRLAKGGENARAARLRLADHVLKKYLASAEVTRSVNRWEWKEWAKWLGQDLRPAGRRAWAGKLRDAFRPPESLAAMNVGEVRDLREALDVLGDEDAASVVVAWASSGATWQSLTPEDQVRLAQGLAKGGEAARLLRLRMTEHIAQRRLATPEATRELNGWHWKEWIYAFVGDLDPATRQRWVTGLRAAFVQPKVLAAMKAEDVVDLTDGLQVLGDEDAHGPMAAYMEANPSWQSMDSWHLARTAQRLAKGGENAKAARLRLAGHLAKKYLVSTEVTRSVSRWEWKEWANSVGPNLDAAGRGVWVAKLREAFGAPKALAVMNVGEVKDLREALDALGDTGASGVVTVWMSASPAWQSVGPGDLKALAEILMKAGDATRPQRVRLAEHVAKAYLAKSETTRGVPCGDWKGLVENLKGALEPATRQDWLGRLRAAFMEPEVLAGLKIGDVSDLTSTLDILGDKEAYGLAAAWVPRSQAWQSASPGDLVQLAENLAKGGDQAKGPRRRLLDHVTAGRLATSGSIRTLSCGHWNGLVKALAKDLEPGGRLAWAQRLRDAFLEPETLASMDRQNVQDLAWALEALGEKTADAYGVVPAWMAASPAWESLVPGDLGWLADALAKRGEATKDQKARLLEHLAKRYLTTPRATRELTCGQWRWLAENLRQDAGPAVQSQWAGRLIAAYAPDRKALGGLDGIHIKDLVEALLLLGEKGKAASLAEQAVAARSWTPEELAMLTGMLSGLGEAGKAARQRITQHVMRTYVADAKAVRSVTCPDWAAFAGNLGQDLPEAQRGVWIGRLRTAYTDKQSLRTLKVNDFRGVVEALQRLGDKGSSNLVASWMLNK